MDQVAYCEHPWLNQFIIVSLYSFLICLKMLPWRLFSLISSRESKAMYLLSGSEFTYIRSPTCLSFAPFPNNLGNFNSLAFPAHMDFLEEFAPD